MAPVEKEEDISAPASGLTNSGTNNHISNPHVTVSLGDSDHKLLRTLIMVLLAIAVMAFFTVRAAGDAAQKADGVQLAQGTFESRINQRVSASETESRQASYWAEQMAVACSNAGIKVPPNPFSRK